MASIAEEDARQILGRIQCFIRNEAVCKWATDTSLWNITVTDTNNTTYKLGGSCGCVNDVDLTTFIRSKLPWSDLVLFG